MNNTKSFWLLLLPLYLLGAITVLKEDERGIEILYENCTAFGDTTNSLMKKDEEFWTAFSIAEGRKVGDYPFPAVEVFVGIPQEGDISLLASGEEEKLWEGKISSDFDGNPLPKVIPQKPLAEIKNVEYLREIRAARVHIFPVQKEQRGIKVYNKIKLQIKYSQPPQIVEREDYFDDVYEEFFINGKRAKFYKVSPPKNLAGVSFFNRALNWVKIKIDSSGIYKITGRDLKEKGIPISTISPLTLQIYNIGRYITNQSYPDSMVEIPIYIFGEEDGKFDEEDFILFYGERINSLYTIFNYYWLTYGVREGKRMDRYLGIPFPATSFLSSGEDFCHWEFDRLCPARSGLLWLWDYFPKGRGEEKSYRKELSLPQGKILKSITLAFYSSTDTSRLQLFLNNKFFDSIFITTSQPPNPFIYKKDTLIPCSEDVALDFVFYGDKESEVYLDWIEIGYEKDLTLPGKRKASEFTIEEIGNFNVCARGVEKIKYLFEIKQDTNFLHPQPVMVEDFYAAGDSLVFGKTNYRATRFLIVGVDGTRRPLSLEIRRPGNLRRSDFDGDYFIITPDEFFRTSLILRNYRNNNIRDLKQARALAVKLSEIYDEYGFGLEEPGVIKKFLIDKHPYFVVLVGDGNYDYRGVLPYPKNPGVPVYEFGYDFSPNPYTWQAYACDAWYADLDGNGSMPDIVLSRLPVRNEKELKQVIEKIINFETKSGGLYQQRFLLLADDEFNGYYDKRDDIPFGRHMGQCEDIGQMAGNNLELIKIYLHEYPYAQYGDKPEARKALLRWINEGVLLMCFFGHGWGDRLTHENVLNSSFLGQIRNGDRLFFGFYGSCGVGKFDETEYECLAEELSRMPGGAVATVAASKATGSSANYTFAQSLFSLLFTYRSGVIGKGFLIAWSTERKYHFFGDGATYIPLPQVRGNMTVAPETLRPQAIIEVTGEIPIKDGNYQILCYGPKLYRYYISPIGLSLGYILPGEAVFQGRGKIAQGRIEAKFLFPKFPYPEVTFKDNGSYTLMPNTARIRLMATEKETSIYLIRGELPFINREVISADSQGPEITIYYQGRVLQNGDKVESVFNFEGRLYDESGINLLSYEPYSLGFYIDHLLNWVDLRGAILFDYGSYKSARFRKTLNLNEPCSLVVIATDNLGNRTEKKINIGILTDTNLIIEQPLYYSSGSSGYFTFYLSRPAEVSLKVYTISGRFVFETKVFGQRGFNKIYFAGRDKKGKRLGSGLYLYRLSAKDIDQRRADLVEKFIIKD